MNYTEMLRKMLMGATQEAPPVPTTVDVKEPSPEDMAQIGQAAPSAPAAPPQIANLASSSEGQQDTTKDESKLRNYKKTTTYDPASVAAMQGGSADIKALLGSLGKPDPAAMARAQDQDRSSSLLKNLGLASSTLAKATSGGRVNGDAFWQQLGGPSEVDKLQAQNKENRALTLEKAKLIQESLGNIGKVANKEETLTDLTNTVGNTSTTKKDEGQKQVPIPQNLPRPESPNLTYKKGQDLAGQAIPGYEPDIDSNTGRPVVALTAPQAEVLRSKVAGAKNIIQTSAEMVGKFNDSSTWQRLTPSDKRAALGVLYANVQDMKRIDAGWGAPQKAEFEKLEATYPDPTKLSQSAIDSFDAKSLQSAYKTLQKLSMRSLDTGMAAHGRKRDTKHPIWQGLPGDVTGAPSSSSNDSSEPTVRVRMKGTNDAPRALPVSKAKILLQSGRFDEVQ